MRVSMGVARGRRNESNFGRGRIKESIRGRAAAAMVWNDENVAVE